MANAIEITSPPAYKTLQRDGSGQATIAMAGTYSGGTPAHVQAKWGATDWTNVSSESIGKPRGPT